MLNKMDRYNISKIVELGLCNGCGTCYSICPTNAISIEENKKCGIFSAKINEKCIKCGKCIKVCPSIEITINDKTCEGIIGNYMKLLYGYSLNKALRFKAASGGIISELLRYLYVNNIVNGFILVKPSEKSPFIYEPFISTNIEDIFKYAGVRYFSIPINAILKELKSLQGKFAIIGTPCQLYGITKYANLDKTINDRIYIKIGFFCGGTPNLNAYKYFTLMNKVRIKGLKSIYRGLGWPGHNVFEYNDGGIVLLERRPKKYFARINCLLSFFPIFAQKRCFICIDRFASYADVSVGDAWLSKFSGDKLGTSLIIIRSPAAKVIFEEMFRKSCIWTCKISKEEILKSQEIFTYYFNNIFTSYYLIVKNKNLIKLKYIYIRKKLSYCWFLFLIIMLLGLKLSHYRILWFFLNVYGIIFDKLYNIIKYRFS